MYDEQPAEKLAIDDDEILRICKSERLTAVGFEGDDELSEQRQTALKYTRGLMDDLKVPGKNRSKAMSSDIADAIETVLPDLLEILAGGEDVGTFRADGPEDEQAAKQETDAVAEIVFDENSGFDILETAIKDALTVKTGIVKVWWKDDAYDTEELEGKTAEELMAMQASGGAEIEALEPGTTDEYGVELFNVTVKRVTPGCVMLAAVDPANFGVSPDTVRLSETPYCVERSFPRAFQLLDWGHDPERVALLRPVAHNKDEEEQRARDTVEESDASQIVHDDIRRTVEIFTHTVRMDGDGDGKTELWEIVTDADETLILSKKRRNRVGYAAGTIFKRPHRFYGESIADKLLEVQRIKTVLIRMMLDNGYFALNRRYEVAESRMSLNTISDLLRNEPGFPVRSKSGDAIRPLESAALNFDVTGALEYMATVAEQRSGVVRNAQGLNPDTLHDTKAGMERLFSAAQRRVRMIARRLAETLIKDLFLCVHGEMRDHANHTRKAKLAGKWVEVDPTSWGSRADMTIELGVGSGGREQEIAGVREIIGLQMQAVEAQAQGILSAPLVSEAELYNSARRLIERMGFKNPDQFFADPGPALELARQNPQPEQPDPEQQAAQAEMQLKQQALQLKQQEAQATMQLKQQAAQTDVALEREKSQATIQAMREKHMLEIELHRERQQVEAQLAREKAQAEFDLAREKADMEAQLAMYRTQREAELSENRPGGRLDQ